MFNTIFANDVQNTLDLFRRSMDQFFDGFDASSGAISDGGQRTFTPTFEAGWTDDKLSLRVVLPAVSEKDVKVTVQGNQLLLEGERKAPEGFSANGYSCLPYGKFFRAIDLPNSLDLDKMSCRLHDGVLDVEIPVKAEMKPRQIPVSGVESRKALAA
jgi:HSP20 family protein